MLKLRVNGQDHAVEVEPDTPLLWVLRDHLNLTGTKYGCGQMLCGACTVHLDGKPQRTCMLAVSEAVGKSIVTIEGLPDGPLRKAWLELQVPQCGYCQSGQLMTAAALLAGTPKPSDAEIEKAMLNLCRCGTYPRIRRAIRKAAGID